ncbi:hypothetical protein BDV18DRAFT_156418 [Aspergillus unguis]
MSQKLAIKQIPLNNRMSQHEHSPREGRTFRSVKHHEVASDDHKSKPHAQQPPRPKRWQPDPAPDPAPYPSSGLESMDPTTEVQARVPNRRVQARSSSLFEEWKSKALRDPSLDRIKEKESDTATRAGPSATTGDAASGAVRGRDPRGDRPQKGINVRAKNKPLNDARGRQSDPRIISGNTTSEAVEAKEKSKEPSEKTADAPVRTKSAKDVRSRQSEAGSVPKAILSEAFETRGRSKEPFEKPTSVLVNARPTYEIRARQPEATDTPKSATTDAFKAVGCSEKISGGEVGIQVKVNPANVARGRQPGTSRFQPSAVSGDIRVSLGKQSDKPGSNRLKKSPAGDFCSRQLVTSKGQESVMSGDVRVALGEHPNRIGNVQAKGNTASDTVHQHLDAVKFGEFSKESITPAGSPNTSVPTKYPKTPPRGRISDQQWLDRQRYGEERMRSRERKRSVQRQQSLERQLHIRGRSREPLPYEAPNGTHFSSDEMRKLALGLNLKNNDTVYFLPCFVDNPWRGLKPTPAVRPVDLMDRF